MIHSFFLVAGVALASGDVTQNSVGLSWTAVSDNSVVSYTVSYRVASSQGAVFEEVTSVTTTAYTVTGLDSYIEYDFVVKAVYDNGLEVLSAELKATTLGEYTFHCCRECMIC